MDGFETEDNKGMIPRAVEQVCKLWIPLYVDAAQVFKTAADMKDLGWNYEMEAFFLEIYNETIRDLLDKGGKTTQHTHTHTHTHTHREREREHIYKKSYLLTSVFRKKQNSKEA